MATPDVYSPDRSWPPSRAAAGPRPLEDAESTRDVGFPNPDLGYRIIEIEAPGAVARPLSIPDVLRRPADPVAVARSDSKRWLDAHLVTIFAVSAAAPAIWSPAAWIVTCAVVAIMIHLLGIDQPGRSRTAADVVAVPAQAAGRALVGVITPLVWLDVLVVGGAVLASAIGLSAAAGGLRWLFSHGTQGALVAARLGAWAYTPRVAAFGVCLVLLRGTGRTAHRRSAALAHVARRCPERALVALAVIAIAGAVVLVAAGPRAGSGPFASADGLGWLPVGLRATAETVRVQIVNTELGAVTSCLDGKQPYIWTPRYTAGRTDTAPDVARLTAADATRPPAPVDVAAAALAMHNQLASWIDTIEIASGDVVLVSINRRDIGRSVPLTDAAVLASHAATGADLLTGAAATVSVATVLDCSARTPL